MYVYGVTESQLQDALADTNLEYDGNLVFRRGPERVSRNCLQFTITVNDSSGTGAKYNHVTGRRVSAACWHAHGDLFETLLDIEPNARIVTGYGPNGSEITADGGNWQDWAATGIYYGPMMASQMCNCCA